eukprot:COSAG02_NODE_24811_length_677_cov_0.773356_1_plen_109_part_01
MVVVLFTNYAGNGAGDPNLGAAVQLPANRRQANRSARTRAGSSSHGRDERRLEARQILHGMHALLRKEPREPRADHAREPVVAASGARPAAAAAAAMQRWGAWLLLLPL